MRLPVRALLVMLCLVTPVILSASEYDDCDAPFSPHSAPAGCALRRDSFYLSGKYCCTVKV